MKGDYTRFTHAPRKHYTRVLRQQGRVDLDADWNEQIEIERHLERTTARDVIGPYGAPADEGGFRIGVAAGGADLSISRGRMYVDGILCENEADATYLAQPDSPGPAPLAPAAGRRDLVYLDVWERHVTALEDPDVREVALGGPDTANRVKTVWQVKVRRGVDAPGCEGDVPSWEDVARPSGGRLTTDVTREAASDDPCVLPPGGGFRGIENRLYRVEVHDGGDLGEARFKWSRDNGSVVFPVVEFSPMGTDTLRLQRIGRDKELAIRPGDWVEVLDDATELREEPGTMARVLDVVEERQVVQLDRALPARYALARHARVRRWDQEKGVDGDGLLATGPGPVELEDGVLVSFGGGGLRVGDYWTFAARTLTRDVDRLVDEPPRGIRHHYAPLAIVEWAGPASGMDLWGVLRAFARWLSTEAEDPVLREQGERIAQWIEEKAKELSPEEMVDSLFEALSKEEARERVAGFAMALVAAAATPAVAERVKRLVDDVFDLAGRPGLAARAGDAVQSLFVGATRPELAAEAEEALDAAFAWLAREETRAGVEEHAAKIEEEGSPELASFLRWLHETLLRPEIQGGIRTVLRGLFEQAERPDVQETVGEWVERGVRLAVGPGARSRAHAAMDGILEAAASPEVQERAGEIAKRLYGMILDSPARDWTRALAEWTIEQASGTLPETLMRRGFEVAGGPYVKRAGAWIDARKEGLEVRDLRRVFTPLTALASGCCVATVGDGKRSFGRFRDVQAAVDAVDCGGTVCVLPGTYVLADTVVIERDDVTLCGCGGPALVQAPAGKPAFLVRRARGVTLCDLRVEATAGEAAIVVRDSSDVAVEACEIRNARLAAQATDGVPTIRGARRTPSFVPAGPAILARDSRGVRVSGNETLATALAVTTGDGAGVTRDVEIRRNRARGGGVWIRDGTFGVRVLENDIADGEGAGVRLGSRPPAFGAIGVEGVVVADNRIEGMGGSGVTTVTAEEDELDDLGEVRDILVQRNLIRGCARRPPDPDVDATAVGGVVLREASRVRVQDNRIEANPGAADSHACGIFLMGCVKAEALGNVVVDNGGAAQADATRGTPGGIVATLVAAADPFGQDGRPAFTRDGTFALRVHDNVVVCPRGPALSAIVYGAASIQGNSFSSHGLVAQRKDGGDAKRDATFLAVAGAGRVVNVLNFGRGAGGGAGANADNPDAKADARTGAGAGRRLPDGRVLFHGNQVALVVEGTEEETIAAASSLLSADEIHLADNQFLAEAGDASVNTNVHAQGTHVRATGNRFAEIPGRATYSYRSNGTWNLALGNQAMHCLVTQGTHVEAGFNQVMFPGACQERQTAYDAKEAPR